MKYVIKKIKTRKRDFLGSHAQGKVHLSGRAKELAAADHITPTVKNREHLGNTGMLGFSLLSPLVQFRIPCPGNGTPHHG